MLELKNIYYERDGKKILNNVNLKIDLGKFIAITGPNGSGKSTLVKVIMGIIKPDKGQVIFEGQDITKLEVFERAKLGIGFAFQQPVKFKGITVHDLLRISSNKDLSKKESCQILSKVGLCAKEYVDREIDSSLSGGELKRIEIATVVLREAKLTIFDEPEAGIDLWSFQNLIEIFEDIRKTTNGTTLIISHQEKILNIANQIILMKDGQISKIGDKSEITNIAIDNKGCCKLGGNV